MLCLNRYMSYSLTSGKKDDTVPIISLVAFSRNGRNVAWSFVKEHWNTLYSK